LGSRDVIGHVTIGFPWIGLSSLLHDQLHWLNVPERIEYKLAVMIRRCLGDKAPTYLSDYCIPVTAVSSRHVRSVNQHQLTVPR